MGFGTQAFKNHFKADSNAGGKVMYCDALQSEMQVRRFTG